jgi:prepilin-type N-terminal cleavage/methylation domain-containing protein
MRERNGVTLVEVVLAILIFAIGGLGLTASAATVARQISTSTLRARAVTIARERGETALGSECGAIADGAASLPAIRSTWTASGVTLDQRIERTDSRGIFHDRFLSALPCP